MFSQPLDPDQVVIIAGLLMILLVLIPPRPPARAGVTSRCRANPTVYLSDGTILTVIADIDGEAAGVTHIIYSVHTPPGVNMTGIVHSTLPGFGAKETFSFADDAAADQIMVDTTVGTTGTDAAVAATIARLEQYQTATGVSSQRLRATLSW